MLRYDRQTKPGLVALYDIRPGKGAGPFLQSRSPHGAGAVLHSSNESSELSQWPCGHDDSTINIVMGKIIYYYLRSAYVLVIVCILCDVWKLQVHVTSQP